LYALLVGSTTLLAAGVAGAVTWLTERPILHARFDLTAAGRNTLAPALAELIDKLPERVYVDAFFQDLDNPMTRVGREAQGRMAEILFVAQAYAPDKLKVVDHDLSRLAEAEQAMRELGVHSNPNVIVVHKGEQRAVLRLFSDVARVDPGNPAPNQFVPPHITSFHGEEALAKALKRVTRGAPPRILFTSGHAERNLFGSEQRELGALHTLLVSDGFRVENWDARQLAEIPDDCEVLCSVDPKQPFSASEAAAIDAFLARGGRFLAAPGQQVFDTEGGLVELLRRWGVDTQVGYVANPVPSAAGMLMYGMTACGNLFIGADGMSPQHPVTESLHRLRYTAQFPLTRFFRRGTMPAGAIADDLFKSGRNSWRDLPDANDKQDWRMDTEQEEQGPFSVCMAIEFDAPKALLETDEAARPARIIALGSPEVLNNGMIETNAPLALNAFNWLSSREYRITIPTREDDRRILPVQGTSKLSVVYAVCVYTLPGLCALLGLALWQLRRR
jgi:hypothetical protein